jgi:hypothetical protein
LLQTTPQSVIKKIIQKLFIQKENFPSDKREVS